MATLYDRRRKRARKAPINNALVERTGARLAALEKDGIKVKGVDGTDGYTRQEARRVKRARRRQKYNRLTQRYLAGFTEA